MTSPLPAHARVVTGDDVWMETDALDQLARIAALPACRCAVGLPDLHPGRGIPVGAAFAFAGEIHPRLVGGDAGCGVRMVAVPRAKHKGDALLRRLEAAMDDDPLADAEPTALLTAAGLADVDGLPRSLAELAALEPPDPAPEDPDGPVPAPAGPHAAHYAHQLGTVGGGNHFVELSRVDRVADKPAARALGLTPGGWAVVAHSGSRGLGGAFADDWHAPVLDPADQARYLARLRGALNYARANRFVLCWRLLDALGAARPGRIAGAFDLIHNTVLPAAHDGAPIWLHRKGAAPADAGEPTVVLGSRGAPSWVMRGAGRVETLCSVAHGAGRKMARGEAVAKMRAKYDRASLARTDLGGHVFCDDPQLLFAEHPDAYKPIDPIIAALEAEGCATRIAALVPFATFKK